MHVCACVCALIYIGKLLVVLGQSIRLVSLWDTKLETCAKM